MSEQAQVTETAEVAAPESSESAAEPEKIAESSPKSAKEQKAINDMIKELELDVYGKKVKKKVNLSDIESLTREFQIAEANKGGMQKAAEFEKLYQQEMKNMKDNPWEYLKKLGLDPDKMSEERILQKIEQMKKTPDQIAREQKDQEAIKHREDAEKYKKELEQERLLRSQEKELVSFMDEKNAALKEYKSLPNSQKVQNVIVEEMIWAIEELEKAGIRNPKVPVADVLPIVEARLIKENNELFDGMPEDAMEKYIGIKNAERLRNKRLADMKNPPALKVHPTAKSVNPPKKQDVKKELARDFFRNLK